jgi:hypothetical protein
VAFAGAALLVAWAGSSWQSGIKTAFHHDEDAPMRAAQAWVLENVQDDGRLLVDNAVWTDLVLAGMPEDHVVWFYKLDLDPVGVGAGFEGGFRDFDYIVSTQTMRDTAATLPNVSAAIQDSVVVATFGTGVHQIDIRRILPEGQDLSEASDRSFVVDLYDEMLGREPSREELRSWLSRLLAGEVDRDGVVQSIADSPEHVGRNGDKD